MKEGKNEGMGPEQNAEQAPQVYAVQKDLTGWRFSRRGFLTAAGATAAAAVAGTTAGCNSTPEVVVTRIVTVPVTATPPEPTDTPVPTDTPEPTLSPEEKMTACFDVKAHDGDVWYLAISPDGTLLALGPGRMEKRPSSCGHCRMGRLSRPWKQQGCP